jgi:hypothetical protein
MPFLDCALCGVMFHVSVLDLNWKPPKRPLCLKCWKELPEDEKNKLDQEESETDAGEAQEN